MVDNQNSAPDQSQRSYRRWIVTFVVVSFVGYEMGKEVRPEYRGRVTIQVSQTMNSVASDIESVGQRFASEPHLTIFNGVEADLASKELMKSVIIDYDLLNNEGFTDRGTSASSIDLLASDLAARVKTHLRSGTELIDVSITHGDQDVARDLANWVAEGFVRQYRDRRLNTNRYVNGVLTNEMERLKIRLRHAEVALNDFKRTSGLLVSLEEHQTILESKIRFISAELDFVDRNLARVEGDVVLVASFGTEPSAAQWKQVPVIWNSESVQRYREMLPKIETKMEVLTLEHGESHPELEIERKMLRRAGSWIMDAMRRMANRFPADVNRLKMQRNRLQEQLVAVEKELLQLSEYAVEYNVLAREVEGTKALYVLVLDRIKEIDLSAGLMDTIVTIIEPASGASDISPRRNLLASALTGLVLALVGVFMFDHFPFWSKPKG
jgi:uncharacterized protein involved in exopolysaccharide biosynthesis